MKKKLFNVCILLVSLIIVSCSSVGISDRTKTVNVSGVGEVSLTADLVSFCIKVSEVAETTKFAQQNTNVKINKLIEILKAFGIADDDIKTESLDISTAYEWQENKQVRIGERVTQTVSAKLRNIGEFGRLMDNLSDVTGISIFSVNFDASNKAEALKQARMLAFEDAKEKALIYCNVSGMKLSDPVLISEGYSTYNARTINSLKMAEDMAYGTEIPSGLLKVSVNVECSFEIKKGSHF